MLEISCMHNDSDDDCFKCGVYGYIFSCPNPCPDYKGFFPHDRQEPHWFEQAMKNKD